jgi:hypothetical protein
VHVDRTWCCCLLYRWAFILFGDLSNYACKNGSLLPWGLEVCMFCAATPRLCVKSFTVSVIVTCMHTELFILLRGDFVFCTVLGTLHSEDVKCCMPFICKYCIHSQTFE